MCSRFPTWGKPANNACGCFRPRLRLFEPVNVLTKRSVCARAFCYARNAQRSAKNGSRRCVTLSPRFANILFFICSYAKRKGDTVSPLSPFAALPASILKHACYAPLSWGAEPVEGRSIWRGWYCQPSPPGGREGFPSGDQCPTPAASAESSSRATMLVILIMGLTAGPAVSL